MPLAKFLEGKIKEANVTKATFAKNAGIEPTELNRILNHVNKKPVPSDKVLNALSKYLNISRETLIDICYSNSGNKIKTIKHNNDNPIVHGDCYTLKQEFNLTLKEIARQTIENDNERYKLDDSISMGDENQWSSLYQVNPDGTYFFYDTNINKIVGDIFFVIPEKEIIDKIESESIMDYNDIEDNFNIDNVLPLDQPSLDRNSIFILNMGFTDDYFKMEYTEQMLKTFVEYLIKAATNGFIFNNIFVRAIDKRDERFYKNLGFIELSKAKGISPNSKHTYIMHFEEFPKDFKSANPKINALIDKLKSLYNEAK